MVRPRALVAVALVALSLCAGPVRAEQARVLLIPSGAGDPVTARLVDELVALGMTVEVANATSGDLPAIASARGVRAALRVDLSRRVVDLWVAGSAAAARVEALPDDRGEGGGSLALRAVELLRGRLLQVEQPAASTPRTEPPPKPAAPQRPRPATPAPATAARSERRPRIAMHIGPSLVLHPGSAISPSGAAEGGARWALTERIDGEVAALAPVVPGALDAPTGEARLSTVVVGAGASIELLDWRRPLSMRAGIGIGAGFLSYDGEPSTGGVRARDGFTPYALPFVRWNLAWRFYDPLSLRADVLGGIAAPRPVIRLSGREDVPFGRPLLALGLQLEVAVR